jgi:SAM-dependent methyltransferase
MSDPTGRFTGRADIYAEYRPSYPAAVLEILRRACGLAPETVVADIGSGTGKSAEPFLANGNRVFAVEPNAEMRLVAERLFGADPKFVSVDGRAEATGMPGGSVDMIVAGQAYHWFDPVAARAEFLRILKPGGWVVLIWNTRLAEGNTFLAEYEALIVKFATDYRVVDHRNIGPAEMARFFGSRGFSTAAFGNHQDLDYAGLEGRLLSSSYIPARGRPNHEEMIRELRALFEAHARDGRIRIEYRTDLHYGQLE